MQNKIKFLDHVAIRVKDLQRSAKWYAEVLGLTRYQPAEWGDFPVMMLAGESGIALFPGKNGDKDYEDLITKFHYAFRVDLEVYRDFKTRFEKESIPFYEQDHIHFISIYLQDPDGHTVELTAKAVN